MFKRALLLLSLVFLPAVLSACGLFGTAGAQLSAGFNPTQIGFEVDDTGGIEIISNNVTFRNPPGAPVATITGYEIQVYDEAGSEFLGIGSELFNHHLAIEVPAGYACPDGESQNCELATRIPQATASEAVPFVFLDGPTAIVLLDSGLNRARAEVTFYADAGGAPYEWTESVTVTYPVGDE